VVISNRPLGEEDRSRRDLAATPLGVVLRVPGGSGKGFAAGAENLFFENANSNKGLRGDACLLMKSASTPWQLSADVPLCHESTGPRSPVQPPTAPAAQNQMTVRSRSRARVDGCLQTTGLLRKLFIARMTSHREALVDFVIKESSPGNK
jgi:hypothetical protein